MCWAMYDSDDESILHENMFLMFKHIDKFRYKIKEIGGDYYYEKMPMGEMVNKIYIGPDSSDKVLRSIDDVNRYVADNINIKIPMDGP